MTDSEFHSPPLNHKGVPYATSLMTLLEFSIVLALLTWSAWAMAFLKSDYQAPIVLPHSELPDFIIPYSFCYGVQTVFLLIAFMRTIYGRWKQRIELNLFRFKLLYLLLCIGLILGWGVLVQDSFWMEPSNLIRSCVIMMIFNGLYIRILLYEMKFTISPNWGLVHPKTIGIGILLIGVWVLGMVKSYGFMVHWSNPKLGNRFDRCQKEGGTRLNASELNLLQIPPYHSYLKPLRHLNLSHNKIKDLSALQDLKQLTNLDLNSNEINHLAALQDLKQLTDLDLHWNQVQDITDLRDLTSLRTVNLESNKINDVSALQNLMQLTVLDLAANQISDVSALRNLTELTRLDLDANPIHDVSALQNLSHLRKLSLQKTEIHNFNLDLNQFPNLRELYLFASPIQNIPIEILGGWNHNCLYDVREYQKTHRK